ncbi:MAG: hypothetical protein HUJ51_06690 [Eggerthellaceae bacterium]|nr:hypothetical protein [Eggerthellaceae bacterium]
MVNNCKWVYSAVNGGDGVSLKFNSGTLDKNKTLHGGAFCINFESNIMESNSFTDNVSTPTAGGVWVNDTGKCTAPFIMIAGELKNNYVDGSGSGLNLIFC